MEQSLLLHWIIFFLIWATIITVVTVFLIFVLTRWCNNRRVDNMDAVSLQLEALSCMPRGIDPTVVETFPKFTYNLARGRKQCRGMLVCVICLGVFKEDETLRSMPKCGHVFHSDCVDSWLKSHATCPCCRANLCPKLNGSSGLSSGFVRLI
ncbi:hypothetical protein RND81_04G009000 [Saponaria officinalis]|uniref:RING-type E3 ubiquitin transferase n=1 Tax=Saponaria officinalis TaxID=3572 RepID=A0AAW1LGJ6_SAPOF